MLMLGSKWAVGLIVMASVIGAPAAFINDRAWADKEPGRKAPPRPAEAQDHEKLKALLQERRAFAKQQFDSSRRDATESLKKLASLSNPVEYESPALRAVSPLHSKGPFAEQMAGVVHLLDAQRLYRWAQRLLTAELELSDKKADRVAAYQAHLQRMKEVEDGIKKEVEGLKGGVGVADVAEAKFHRLEAEIMLERAKAD